MKFFCNLIPASVTFCCLSAAAAAESSFTMTPAVSIEIPQSAGKFDFLRVDSKHHRLLAAHEKDGTSDFIDLQNNTLLSRVKTGAAVDTAVDADAKLYYVSVQEGERVAVVDAASLKEVNSIKMGGPTDAIIFEPKNHMVYVTHDDGMDVWVIDPATAKVAATIAIPGVPEFMVYDAQSDKIYLNIKTKDVVAVIDPGTNQVIAQWSTGAAKQPHGLALDPAAHAIFAAGGNGKLVAIDTKTGSLTATVDITPKVDQIAFDAAHSLVYCAGTDKMSVVKATDGKLTAAGEIATASTARNVAVDPATHLVWTTYTDGKNSYAKAWMPPKP
jgi:YVTN family beta-propeller protein